MKLQYVEKNVKTGILATIELSVSGLLDAHEYSDVVTYHAIRLQISDDPKLAVGYFKAWMENHDFINVSDESLEKKQAFVRKITTAITDGALRMEKGEVKHDNLVSMGELELPEGRYDIGWKISAGEKRDLVIEHHLPLETFAPSFPVDINELAAFELTVTDWNSDQGKHNLKSLAYWSRLRHYRPSSEVTQADLITFYNIWLKLSHEERDTYRSFIESL